ncbi:A/G-specific adenine glycosylase [Sulfurimonas sp.]|uniref:A/G-specific adenine glycosylase n=1 Tax=Sulfurimonas sp. TaxID=2022749 RepID=UPI00260D2844|nr:A/G-specific adenine glycosylase [Sulfurimonas sp.]
MKKAQAALLCWYEDHGRHELPWRNTQDIYCVYLSEIMLQQTQVHRVRDQYYPQFLEKFPTLQALGNAPLDDVLAAWSGLGYYSRARNLHKTAQLCSDGLPQTKQELLKLPGIGSYTASAVCSFGYHQAEPVVDTNIARVIKRFFALSNAVAKELERNAVKLLNTTDPRSHNLALMDLGAMLCLPKNPKCTLCPLQTQCQGKNEPEIYTQKKKTVYENMELFYGILKKENKIALIQAEGNMYKNMLTLPSIDPTEEDFLASFKHSYTKYRLTVKLYKLTESDKEFIWLNLDDIDKAPLSSLTKKALFTVMR